MSQEVPRRRLISLADAAQYAGVSQKTVRRRIAEGQLTGYRMAGGRVIRVDLADVEAMFRPIPTVH